MCMKLHIFKVYNLMSVGICNQLCNYHHSQDNEHSRHLQKHPAAPRSLFIYFEQCCRQNVGLPRGSDGKESAWQCRRQGFDPWVGKLSWRSHGNPLQCSFLKKPMDREAWWATVHRVTKSRT